MRRFLALQWLLLCSAADVQVVDMYRALKKPSGGEEGDQRLENNNLADILGVLRYLHQEVVVEHAVGDPERTERKYGIDAIARYRVTLKNPTKLDASSSIMGFSPKFSAFDYGIATNPDTLKELAEVGDFVGIQKKDPFVDASMAVSYPYYWFSLPGKCPNLPWTCLKGSNHADCTHTDEEVGVLPVSCKDVGCAGKSDEEAAQCKADFETPETLQDCCLKYTGPSFSNKLRKAGEWEGMAIHSRLFEPAGYEGVFIMGTKVAVMYAFCSVFACVLQAISANVKWHSLRMMLGAVTMMKLETSLIYTRMDTGASMLCNFPGSGKLKLGRCDELSEGITLQDAADEWCAPLVVSIFPNPCFGFRMAYFMGLANLFAIAVNVIAICVCLFLVVQYIEGTLHKGMYRTWALIIHLISTAVLLGAFLAYILVAINALDDVGGVQVAVMVMSNGTGVSIGVWIMGAGLIFQFLAAALLGCVKLGEEETSEDREIRKWMKEQNKWEMNPGYGTWDQSGSYTGQSAYGAGMHQQPEGQFQQYPQFQQPPAADGQFQQYPAADGQFQQYPAADGQFRQYPAADGQFQQYPAAAGQYPQMQGAAQASAS
ncbi:unnamed protein product [Effrenium voratum]|uniref:Uncharacterized protein n=1 Tax=Effrenium voratum TaxID=2562239 RepID=A0AA36J7E5_9DINO|nr:unnamed protein product [Effrenium voratum]